MSHASFATTTRRLDRTSFPMRLFEKAKRLGVWNPSDIDFSQDRADWLALSDAERDLVLRLTTLFQAGEEAVTIDILPLIGAIAADGRIEEELFLTTFLFEEAKHTDFFGRFLEEVAQTAGDLSRYHTPHYRAMFYEALPTAMGRLRSDSSPLSQARASLTYNMIVEGVLAETGYHAFFAMLERRAIMPGTRRGIALLKQDESRHIAYGLHLLARLVAADPQIWQTIEGELNEQLLTAMGVIDDAFLAYDVMPFGLTHDDFMSYAMGQFARRTERLERACAGLLDDEEEPTDAD